MSLPWHPKHFFNGLLGHAVPRIVASAPTASMSRVRDRVVLGFTFALAAAALLALNAVCPPGLVPWWVASGLTFLGVWELARMGSLRELRLGRALGAAAVGTSVFCGYWSLAGSAENPLFPLLGYLVALILSLFSIIPGIPGTGGRAKGGWRRFLLAAWCCPPLFGLVTIEARWEAAGLVALLALSKVGDVFAYFVGRAVGRTHPFPNLSPGKTTAGFVASFVAALAAGALLVVLGVLPDGRLGMLGGILAGLILNLFSQAGDLFESWVKRGAGVKDSSELLGAAGGVLDLVDSLLFSIPITLLTWPLLFPREGFGA